MLPLIRLGRTNLQVTRLGLGGYPFGGVNAARGWDPFSPAGAAQAIRTIHAALDAGIKYIDTAPGYGNGNSETLIGQATHDRRDRFVLATKVKYAGLSPQQLIESVEASLKRLQTDVIDILQFHGGMYTDEQVRHIRDVLLDPMEQLRRAGKVRFLGFTVEEPWTAKPLIATGRFDLMQVRYNLIYQSAALHVLNEATQADMAIAVMRPMTSGIFQRIASYLMPQWQEAELYDLTLKFVLSDSRIHVANVGMRWPSEVAHNIALTEHFLPPYDMATLPRLTAAIYKTEDEARAK